MTQQSVTAHRIRKLVENFERTIMNPVIDQNLCSLKTYGAIHDHRAELMGIYQVLLQDAAKRQLTKVKRSKP